MTDSALLKERIEMSGLKIRAIAERMSISYQAFYNKLNGKTEFVASEIVALTSILKLSKSEQNRIFFKPNVANKVTSN